MSTPFARRRTSADLPSALVAAAISIAGFAAVLAVSAGAVREYRGGTFAPVALARERVDFLSTRPRIVVAAPARTNLRVPPFGQRKEARRPQQKSANPADSGTTRVAPSNAASPSLAPPLTRPRYLTKSLIPPAPQNPFVTTPPPTRAEVDSMLRVQRDSFAAFAARRVMSVDERDALMHVMANSKPVPGRAAQMPGYPGPGGLGAAGGISAPLFSPGPSVAERRRDSAANVEYLARLRRLQDRVAARRESLRVADSMSRARFP